MTHPTISFVKTSVCKDYIVRLLAKLFQRHATTNKFKIARKVVTFGLLDGFQHIQRYSLRGRPVLQQDSMLLLRGAKVEPERGGGHARIFLHRPGIRRGSVSGERRHNFSVLHLLRVEAWLATSNYEIIVDVINY